MSAKEQLLLDYQIERVCDVLSLTTSPDKGAVNQLLDLLMEIVYPKTKSISYLSFLIDQAKALLTFQLDALNLETELITEAFITSIPSVRAKVSTDLEAAFDGDPAALNYHEIVLAYPGLFTITTQRLAHELHLLGVPLIPRMMTEHAHSMTGIDIHPGANIGNYFFIDHGTGIVIGETTTIGEHVKIYQGVTLGALSTSGGQRLKGKKRHPTILNNVTIYSGASILGGETVIGENCVIGSNVFITKSIPSDTKVSLKNQEINYRSGRSSILEQDI